MKYNHFTGTHAVPCHCTLPNLSIKQEDTLITKINAYAERGTLLTPWHVTQLANALSERPVGVNWTSTFLRRHHDQVSLCFYQIQELARLKADTPSNRQAFYALVSHFPALWGHQETAATALIVL